jgi:hypothetical protein
MKQFSGRIVSQVPVLVEDRLGIPQEESGLSQDRGLGVTPPVAGGRPLMAEEPPKIDPRLASHAQVK